MTNKLSPEAQTCFEQVQKAPENQKQSTFERACQLIKDKTQIALLATMLGLGLSQAPEVQAGEPQRVERASLSPADQAVKSEMQSYLGGRVDQDIINTFFELYMDGKNRIDSKWNEKYSRALTGFLKAIQEENSLESLYNRGISKMVINTPENQAYLQKFQPFIVKYDAVLHERIAESKRRAAVADQRAEGYEALTATLKGIK